MHDVGQANIPPDVEEATGRSQWEAPGYDHSRAHGDDSRGHDSAPGGYSGQGSYPYGGYDSHQSGGHGEDRGDHKKDKKDKKGSSGMLLGAAGGLAVGAVAGAVIAHELSKSTHISAQLKTLTYQPYSRGLLG